MSSLIYHLYDVFTDEPFSGNPLAVFLDAEGLPTKAMARIANELNLSETTFVGQKTGSGGFPVRIFTPQAELPFAGHPTIGTAIAMREAGIVDDAVEFELAAGPIRVGFDEARAEFRAPLSASTIDNSASKADAARLLGLAESDIVAVRGADAGVPFALIELSSRGALRNCVLSLAEWNGSWAHGPTPHIYVFSKHDAANLDARMFAPAMGIHEDPATGGAAAALAAVLPDGGYAISQGEDMGRRSRIDLLVQGDRATIGGGAVRTGGGELSDAVRRAISL